MKRFYKQALYQPCDDFFILTLDDRELKTPEGERVSIPSEGLAKAICDEWNAQGDDIKTQSMPLYSLLVTALDKGQEREHIVSELLPYIDGDLLFYRAPEPIGLVEKQKPLWDDPLKCMEEKINGSLRVTYDLAAVQQDRSYHQFFKEYIDGIDPFSFTIFQNLISLTGSPILAYLACHFEKNADEVLEIIHCEDQYYADLYRTQEEDLPQDQRDKKNILEQDVKSCLLFLSFLK